MSHQGTGGPRPLNPLLVLGGSARALAWSAATAGWAVYAADLFDDEDLRIIAARSVRVDAREYPHSLLAAAESLPPAPWCYTGAVENHPDLIDQLTAIRPLAGNAGAAVRAVRDPLRLGATANAAGLLFPETRLTPAGVPGDGSWLVKPRSSASGRGIHPWLSAAAVTPAKPLLWQRRVRGIPCAASFIMADGRARLLGLSRQLLAEAWCAGGPFAYGGSVTLSAAEMARGLAAQASEIGGMLAEDFRLVGAVGVDLVIDSDGRPWIIEVNPRVTASMELHERATRISVAAAHLAACGMTGPTAGSAPSATDTVWAKAIVHTPEPLAITVDLTARWAAIAAAWTRADGGQQAIADIPTPGQTIAPRAPVLTVFARGDSAAGALAVLRRRVDMLSSTWRQWVSRPSAAAAPPPHHARCIA
jgi:uncharacterized protein